MKKIIISILTLILSASLLVGCENIPSSNKSDWAYIEERGTIIIGYDNHFAPLGFSEKKGCSSIDVGFDIDLAKAIAPILNVKVKLVPINWSNKELELKTKKIDLIWNGFTITDERKANLEFSIPYLKNDQVVLVRIEDKDKYSTIDKLAGKKLGFQEGSSAKDAILDTDEIKANALTGLPNNVDVLNELLSNKHEAAIMDSVVANYYTSKNSFKDKFYILPTPLASEEYGVGLRKGEVEFKAKLDAALLKLNENGKLKEIAQKWNLESELLIK